MSKQDNLTDFLTGVANAIREKKGTSSPINPQDFEDEIGSIETGVDISDTTAVQSDVRLGKAFYTASGTKTNGSIADYDGSYSGGATLYNKLPQVIDKSITSLTIDDLKGATKIGQYSFYSCTNLGTIEIPNTASTIETRAFYNCSKLKPVIPNTITNVGEYAFYSAGSSLGANFDFNANTSCTVGQYAFQSARVGKLTGQFYTIGSYAFSGCSYLTEVDITETATMNTYAFQNCSAMTKLHLTINSSIGSYAFYGCTKVSDLAIGGVISSLGDYAFSRLGASRSTPSQNVLTLDLSNSSFTSIPQYCFGSDSSSYKNQYMNIMFPDTVTTIGNYAFRYSDHCSYYFTSEKAPALSVTTAWSSATNYKIFVPYNNADAYRTATNWTAQASYIYGFADKNTFVLGQTLPDINTEGYGCTWFSDVGLTVPVSTVTDVNAIYYCVVGTTKLAYRINKVTAIDCTVSIVDTNGVHYNQGDMVYIDKTLIITGSPTTAGFTPYIFTLNGVDIESGSQYTVTDSDIAITALYWNGQDVPLQPNFADNEWSVIAIGFTTGVARNFWHVGDTKQVTLTNGETYTIRIADMQSDRYEYADGSGNSQAVLEFVELQTTSRYMNTSDMNAGGWADCYMRNTVMEEIYEMLPDDLKDAISTVNVLSGMGGYTSGGTSSSENKLFLPAEMEIFASKTYSIGNSECPLGQFDWYAEHNTANDRKKFKLNTTSVDLWWSRSPRSGYSHFFCGVNSSGGADRDSANSPYGVAPFFAI